MASAALQNEHDLTVVSIRTAKKMMDPQLNEKTLVGKLSKEAYITLGNQYLLDLKIVRPMETMPEDELRACMRVLKSLEDSSVFRDALSCEPCHKFHTMDKSPHKYDRMSLVGKPARASGLLHGTHHCVLDEDENDQLVLGIGQACKKCCLTGSSIDYPTGIMLDSYVDVVKADGSDQLILCIIKWVDVADKVNWNDEVDNSWREQVEKFCSEGYNGDMIRDNFEEEWLVPMNKFTSGLDSKVSSDLI
ncbi:hypothetical protein BDZ45DRAFT_746489 [Acephala macrosclerotiorum]|nr:hypothetical protein BDZ45DRAFT_746489 [Acephala macrosclerotiorum]